MTHDWAACRHPIESFNPRLELFVTLRLSGSAIEPKQVRRNRQIIKRVQIRAHEVRQGCVVEQSYTQRGHVPGSVGVSHRMLRARIFRPSMEQAAETFALDRTRKNLSDNLACLQIK